VSEIVFNVLVKLLHTSVLLGDFLQRSDDLVHERETVTENGDVS